MEIVGIDLAWVIAGVILSLAKPIYHHFKDRAPFAQLYQVPKLFTLDRPYPLLNHTESLVADVAF